MNLRRASGHRLLNRWSKPLPVLGLALLTAAAAPAQTLFDLATETITPIESLTPQSDILLTQGGEQGLASGDLNGDGQADLVIGAAGRLESTVTPADGKVYIVFGPVNTPVDLTNPLDVDVTIEDADTGDLLGWTSLVADFNNDGQDDLAVGALLGDGPAGTRADAGEIHIFFGPFQPGTLSLAAGDEDVTIYGVDPDGRFGYVTEAHDVNGDGAVDLIAGAPSGAGSVHVEFGPFSAGTIDFAAGAADVTINGAGTDLLGFSIAAGDISGDGHADLVAGAPSSPGLVGPGVIRGDTLAFFGPFTSGTTIQSGLATADVIVTGRTNASRMGFAAAIGDVNDDGVADLVTGTRLGDSPTTSPDIGSTHVLYGPLTTGTSILHDAADLSIYQPETALLNGAESSLLIADASGDGVLDLIIGNRLGDGPNNDRVQAGEAHVLFGPLPTGVIELEQTPANLTVLGDQ
ncbi:MAG: hypothetical protein AAFY88_15130, partial [Acidobacteriota bacterium]